MENPLNNRKFQCRSYLKSFSAYKNTKVIFKKEKRIAVRIPFHTVMFYPRLNGKSMNNFLNEPILTSINLSETGISFKTKHLFNIGDFLNFTLDLELGLSFECFCQIKWVAIDDKDYCIGCEFFMLKSNQVKMIREKINKYLE